MVLPGFWGYCMRDRRLESSDRTSSWTQSTRQQVSVSLPVVGLSFKIVQQFIVLPTTGLAPWGQTQRVLLKISLLFYVASFDFHGNQPVTHPMTSLEIFLPVDSRQASWGGAPAAPDHTHHRMSHLSGLRFVVPADYMAYRLWHIVKLFLERRPTMSDCIPREGGLNVQHFTHFIILKVRKRLSRRSPDGSGCVIKKLLVVF